MSTPQFGPGIEITGRITPEYAQILTPQAVALAAKLQRAFGGRRTELLAARARRQAELDAGRLPDFLPETRAIRDGDWTCAPIPADIVDRRVEITGPVDRKMVINALNSGASVFMADFEDANTPKWDNNLQGHINLARRDPPPDRLHVARGQGVPAEREDRRALRAAARLASAREARAGRRRADLRRHLRFRALRLPQREGAARARQRPLFLPAEARKPPRGAAVERHLRDGAGRARRPARLDQGDRADRDAARGVRDGRDPVRAARALGRAQLRALGLHLLVHQEAAEQPGLLPRRSRARHDDHALHEELRAAPRQDVPPAQHPRDGRDGGADPGQERRGRQCRGVRQGEGRQGARSDAGPRRHLGRASGPRAGRARGVRPADAGAEPDRVEEARRRAASPRRTSSSSSPRPRSPKRGCASTSTSRSSTSARGSSGRAPCRSST